MIRNVPTAFPGETILDIRRKLFEKAGEFETLNYIYIVDEGRRLAARALFKRCFLKAGRK